MSLPFLTRTRENGLLDRATLCSLQKTKKFLRPLGVFHTMTSAKIACPLLLAALAAALSLGQPAHALNLRPFDYDLARDRFAGSFDRAGDQFLDVGLPVPDSTGGGGDPLAILSNTWTGG